MAVRPFQFALMILALVAPPACVYGAVSCKIRRIAELPVTMNGLRPMITAKINGREAQFIADSGAFFSMISPASAAEYMLRTKPAPFELRVQGVGGGAEAWVTTVKEFTLAGVPIHKIQFIVGGSDVSGGAVGLLGQNVLRLADVEYDLANGAIRLMRPDDGCRTANLAYWVKAGDAYSIIDIALATPAWPHTTATAFVNGAKIRTLFDTGAPTSMLTLRAAERAGVKPGGAGVVSTGLSRGIGPRGVQTWIAPFDSFRIGDEEVRHTRLRIAEIDIPDAEMLIGADFFLSHRIYVASSQRKVFFTYNGGPVFNLTSAPLMTADRDEPAKDSEPSAGEPALPASGSAPSASVPLSANESSAAPGDSSPPSHGLPAPPIPAGQPTDAAGFSRRGTAYAARRDFEHAIADLNRACELAPGEASYFHQRALVRLSNRQPELALSDLDQALKLKPDYVPALVARTEVRLARREHAAGQDERNSDAIADIDKASATVANEADVRLELGHLYAQTGSFAQAIAQYDLWLNKHQPEARTPDALSSRCRARGMLGQDLDKALTDCNRALKVRPGTPFFLDSRGLVYLRLNNLDKSIADYDAVLRVEPENAWALYGRGLAKLRKGSTTEGQADIAASKGVQPLVAEEAGRRGLAP